MQRVLIVEQNVTMQHILDTLLRELGAEITATDDFDAALTLLRAEPAFDLLTVDCMGPGQGGNAWLAAAREAAPPHTRILVVSGETRKQRIAAALDAGADEYLMKPFPREALREKLVILALAE